MRIKTEFVRIVIPTTMDWLYYGNKRFYPEVRMTDCGISLHCYGQCQVYGTWNIYQSQSEKIKTKGKDWNTCEANVSQG